MHGGRHMEYEFTPFDGLLELIRIVNIGLKQLQPRLRVREALEESHLGMILCNSPWQIC